jgi:hypothetical protein
MSLPHLDTQAPLFATLTPEFFAPEDRHRLFGSKIFPLLLQARPALQRAYCLDNGRPVLEPLIMAGVTVLQFLEGISDRQAVGMLHYHLGWNFALNLAPGQPLFHPTSLVCFRNRLIEKKLGRVVFAQILEGLVQAGLVERRGSQRLDSQAPAVAKPSGWPLMWERYVASKLDYRTEAAALKEKMNQAGVDALTLLQWAATLSDASVTRGPQMQLLQRVFDENFQCQGPDAPAQKEAQPTGAVHNPHDPQAQWAAKGQGKHKKEHVGYKVQVAENVTPGPLARGEPTRSFPTGIATQPASASDEAGGEQIEQEQSAMGLEQPVELYVDAAYTSGQKLAQAQAQGREIIGPVQAAPIRDKRFSSEDFDIHVEERQAACPAGKPSTQCSRLEEQQGGKVSCRFEWSGHCKDGPLRPQCGGPGQRRTAPWWWANITATCNPGDGNRRPRSLKKNAASATPSKARRASWCGRMACEGRAIGGWKRRGCKTISLGRPATPSGGSGGCYGRCARPGSAPVGRRRRRWQGHSACRRAKKGRLRSKTGWKNKKAPQSARGTDAENIFKIL